VLEIWKTQTYVEKAMPSNHRSRIERSQHGKSIEVLKIVKRPSSQARILVLVSLYAVKIIINTIEMEKNVSHHWEDYGQNWKSDDV